MDDAIFIDGAAIRRNYLAAFDREAELERQLTQAKRENKVLLEINAELRQATREAQRAHEALAQEVQELKRQLAQAQTNSRNSSKRPSSDLVKPLRAGGKGKRKIGGQPGHPKHERQPLGEQELDHILAYALSRCPNCQGPLTEGARPPAVVQQVELVKQPLVEYTEHRGAWYWCARCRKWHCSLPIVVKRGGLCGPVLTAWIGYLKGGCHASFSTIRKFLRDVVGVRISRGQLAKVIGKVSAALAEPWSELRLLLPLAKILNVDETGHKENGQRLQTWCFRARDYVLFKIAESRGTAVLLELLGADFDGIIGCDYFSSYRCYMNEFGGVLQFCLAHLIRDVKFLLSLPDAATQAYGKRYLAGLRDLFQIIHRRGEMTEPVFQRQLEDQRQEVLRVALHRVPASREAQNLAKRMREHGASYFRFITTPGVEPTNNLAEQSIRFVVIDRLVTQGTRSEKGREWCERIWSILATCAQQGASAFHFIRDAVQAFFCGNPAPKLLNASP